MCVCTARQRYSSGGGDAGGVYAHIYIYTHNTVVCCSGESCTEKFQGETLTGNWLAVPPP